jgi:hypothetical protein
MLRHVGSVREITILHCAIIDIVALMKSNAKMQGHKMRVIMPKALQNQRSVTARRVIMCCYESMTS